MNLPKPQMLKNINTDYLVKTIENNENAVDTRIIRGLSQAFGLWSSIHCFYIRLDALFPMHIISNEIQQQAYIWPTLMQSLQCRYTWLVTAEQWINCCLMIQYFRSDALHGSQHWPWMIEKAMCSLLYMSSKLKNRDRSTSSVCSISCLFFNFFNNDRPSPVEGSRPLNRSESGSQLCQKQYMIFSLETWGSIDMYSLHIVYSLHILHIMHKLYD